MSIEKLERGFGQRIPSTFFNIMHTLEKGDGYVMPFSLPEKDLQKIRELLSDHFRKLLRKTISDKKSKIVLKDIEVQKYHQISDALNHQELMQMKNRVLSNEARQVIQEMNFFKAMEEWFPNSTIEDPLGYHMNFRFARPDQESDSFAPHADTWYFSNYKNLGGSGSTLAYEKNNRSRLLWVRDDDNALNFTVVHVWIPIYCEPGLNGLKVAPRSQLRSWQRKKVDEGKHATAFPKYKLTKNEQIELKLLKTEPGEVVLFHDGLVHQGAINRGQETRVALLFNIHIIKK